MTISSRATYILPLLLLVIVALWMGGGLLAYPIIILNGDVGPLILLVAIIVIQVTGFYFLFRVLAGRLKSPMLQALAVALPAVIQLIYHTIRQHPFEFSYWYVAEGMLLWWAVRLLLSRYRAVLTESSIELVNLLGQPFSISLESLTSLEEKKNILSLLRELRFLNVARKTAIIFQDENLDERQVHILTRAFRSTEIFGRIIDQANKNGNYKIRQYRI